MTSAKDAFSDACEPADSEARRNIRQTVESYERSARRYASAVSAEPSPEWAQTLQGLLDAIPSGGSVFEAGSGPGWDADFLEAAGVFVRRTDAAQAFVDFQTKRGKRAELLDLAADDLGGPYDGALALYVLQHIDRALIGGILRRIAASLRQNGVFLASLREGEGEYHERGRDSGVYHIVLWTEDAFNKALAGAGLHPEWMTRMEDDEGKWLVVRARRGS